MTKQYIAVTYDICEHNNLYEDMNEYVVDVSHDIGKKVEEFARKDVAPLVKVFESNTSDFKSLKLYKEYTFKTYECDCDA
ncbi:hypothetical protein [Lentibacillus saliphilus]|uniref:hypothetical protein n=1 Tax=Lentibacillus saliphilus TaxID=2737028 RepID=UPI001C3035ED|nr:hypothetical protein [Lentibacillus saliphilus]